MLPIWFLAFSFLPSGCCSGSGDRNLSAPSKQSLFNHQVDWTVDSGEVPVRVSTNLNRHDAASHQVVVARESMLSEQEIANELRQFVAFRAAYREGMRGNDLPALPKVESLVAEWKVFVISFGAHPLLAVLWKLSQITRVYSASVFFAKTRINTDKYSFEPCSCGLNQAYTRLGLALLKKKDVAGAIDCLAASWRVHPCPHNTSFGLAKRLALALRPYPEATAAVQQYVRMGVRFAMSSSWWPTELP